MQVRHKMIFTRSAGQLGTPNLHESAKRLDACKDALAPKGQLILNCGCAIELEDQGRVDSFLESLTPQCLGGAEVGTGYRVGHLDVILWLCVALSHEPIDKLMEFLL
jgi:hypothetical protein